MPHTTNDKAMFINLELHLFVIVRDNDIHSMCFDKGAREISPHVLNLPGRDVLSDQVTRTSAATVPLKKPNLTFETLLRFYLLSHSQIVKHLVS